MATAPIPGPTAGPQTAISPFGRIIGVFAAYIVVRVGLAFIFS